MHEGDKGENGIRLTQEHVKACHFQDIVYLGLGMVYLKAALVFNRLPHDGFTIPNLQFFEGNCNTSGFDWTLGRKKGLGKMCFVMTAGCSLFVWAQPRPAEDQGGGRLLPPPVLPCLTAGLPPRGFGPSALTASRVRDIQRDY